MDLPQQPQPPAVADSPADAEAFAFSALSQQTVLFEEFGEQPRLVAAAKEYIHSGKIVGKNAELCEAIVTAYASGLVSIRLIAKRLGIGRETVKTIIRLADEAGKLGPLKQRLSGKMGRAIELGLDVLTEKLEAGDVPAQVLPIVIGVLSDKKALLDGEATVRIEASAVLLTADQVRADFDRMKRAIAVTVESESVVCGGTRAQWPRQRPAGRFGRARRTRRTKGGGGGLGRARGRKGRPLPSRKIIHQRRLPESA